ncbi:cupin domain-containing protein [Octadecabacter sp.]|nr:cupin domain-containing protein [Octadecabacter sp.]
MTAQDIIATLNLTPHPEGGFYRQTWQAGDGPRASGTCIYFLLEAGKPSHWHHVDAVEIWHYYAGAPLLLKMAETAAGPQTVIRLGPDLVAGERPQGIVPMRWWQAAQTTGDWTLVGCTVSPGFQFDGFVLADPDFDIPDI